MDQYGTFPFGRDGFDIDQVKHNAAEPPSYCRLFDREPAKGRVHLGPDYDCNAFSDNKTISYQKRAE